MAQFETTETRPIAPRIYVAIINATALLTLLTLIHFIRVMP